jgi:hypothetical protein
VTPRVVVILGAVLGTLGLPRLAPAQAANGSIPAEAMVVTVGMTFTTLRDLGFGTVTKGVATTVQPTDANAGMWQISGNGNSFVTIAFTLPTQLTNIQALPGSTMPVSFGALSARWRRANSDPTGATAFSPALGSVGRFGPNANPTLYIWIGGTVNPALTAKPGIYQGTIILSLTYL